MMDKKHRKPLVQYAIFSHDNYTSCQDSNKWKIDYKGIVGLAPPPIFYVVID